MPNWLIKTALQRAVSVLPRRQLWNELFQSFGTRSLDLTPARFEMRLEHCRMHLDNFLSLQNPPPDSFTVLELGTGWYPIIATGLYVCGAGPIWAIDIDPLLRSSRLHRMLQLFCQYDDEKQLEKFLPRVRRDRMARLRESLPLVEKESPEQCLARLDIHPMVLDAQHTGLPAGSIDLFLSHGVFEYIPRPVLQGILAEFRRLSSARAVMSHWITMADQFSGFDHAITPFNYLRYTGKQWRYLNSPLMWQNRLRISDYRELFARNHYQITKELDTPGSLEDLKKIRIAPEFQKYTEEDLLVLTSWIIAKPA